jgi:lipoprotein-releasing system permease protein
LNLPFFIAKRLATQRQSGFSRYIVNLAIFATAISVATMIVAVSFVNGFQFVIQEKVHGFWGHIRVQQYLGEEAGLGEERPMSRSIEIENRLKKSVGVRSVEAYATKSALLKSSTAIESILLKGVDRSWHPDWRGITLMEGRWPNFPNPSYPLEITLSELVSKRLQVKHNDSIVVFFFRADGSQSARKVQVCGIYKTGIEDYDKNFSIIDLRLIQRLNNWTPDQMGGYELLLQDPTQSNKIQAQLYEALPQSWYCETIASIFPNIFDWLNLQGQIKNMLLLIMIIIAVMNGMTCLIILMLERTRMSGMLKAMGASDGVIQRIFLYQAVYIGSLGIVLGTLLGCGICWLQIATGFIQLDESAYFISTAAVVMNGWEILLIDLGTWLICLLMLILPTRLIKRIQPIKAIRFK